MRGWTAAAIAAFVAAPAIVQPAQAQDASGLRDFCADRPGIGTQSCTVDPGHLQVEVGLADWTRSRTRDDHSDTILAGDAVARLGVGDTTELRLGWTAFGHVRERDEGGVTQSNGIGDVTVGLKQNLRAPDGKGFSVALLPFATLPAGHRDVGAGTWGAGLLVPASLDLNDTFQLELTPEIDAAPDEDRHGRHLTYSSVFGLIAKLSDAVTAEAEIQPLRDRDPEGHETELLGGVSLAYVSHNRLQLDAGANFGLNHHTPGLELYFGVSERF